MFRPAQKFDNCLSGLKLKFQKKGLNKTSENFFLNKGKKKAEKGPAKLNNFFDRKSPPVNKQGNFVEKKGKFGVCGEEVLK